MAKPKIGAKRTDEYYIYSFGQRVYDGSGHWSLSGQDGWGLKLKKSIKSADVIVMAPFQTQIDGYPVLYMDFLFSNIQNLSSKPKQRQIDVSRLDVSKIKSMHCLFNWSEFTQIDGVELLDTSNVDDMEEMFASCFKLESINVSKLNTSKVRTMSMMFSGCCNLKSIDVSNFDTSNVISMWNMFRGCQSVESLDVSGFNTSNVVIMESMFENCRSLKEINLKSFDTSKVTSFKSMFSHCCNLSSIDLSGFDTSNVTSMSHIFFMCKSLQSVDMRNFNTQNVSEFMGCMYGCENIKSIDLSAFNLAALNLKNTFISGCCLKKIIVGSESDKEVLIDLDSNTFNDLNIEVLPEVGTIVIENDVEYRFGLVWNGIMWTTPLKNSQFWGVRKTPKYSEGEVHKDINGFPVMVC